MSIKKKFTSRKFWLTVAAILASVGSAIGGVYTDSQALVMCGIVCTAVSTCIYTISESVIDTYALNSTTESEG